MDLEELKKKLYKEGPTQERQRPATIFEPGQGSQEQNKIPADWLDEPKKTEPTKPPEKPLFSERNKKIAKFSFFGLVILSLIAAGLVFFLARQSFDKAKVTVSIFAPDRVVSGEEVQYVVRYRNDSGVKLSGVKLEFIYPEGAIPIDAKNLNEAGHSLISLADLATGQSNQVTLRANITGARDDQKTAMVKLDYQPENFSSSFENSAEFASTIFSVPLVLSFDLPERVVNGQELSFALKYNNISDIAFSNLVLSVDYPNSFNFESALPVPDENSNTWRLAEISPHEEGQIMIKGVLSGSKDEITAFKAGVGLMQGVELKPFASGMASVIISVSPLSLQLSVNNSRDYIANVGDELKYKLIYQNTTDEPINSAYIILKFDSKVLDFSTLKIDKGFFNNLDSSVTWNESSVLDLKILQPGDLKELEFSVKVKDRPPVKSFNDKNFLIVASAKIDSSNIPISLRGTQLTGTDSLTSKLNSKLVFDAKGFYQDTDMPNSGPLPPRIGVQTTYTIYWQLINLANDVQDVKVESYLPPNVAWLGRYEPNGADVKYDKTTGKITWTIGQVSANTGILSSPAKQLIFQIGLTPGSEQLGQVAELVKTSTITGVDAFTQSTLESQASGIGTDLPDDTTINFNQTRVTN